MSGRTRASIDELLFFALIIAVACYLRVDDDPSTAGFEAAVVFAAVPLLHDPAVALFSVFAGAAVHNVFRDIALKRLRLESIYDAAQRALSYGVVAILYCSAVAAEAPMMARVSGYVLLAVGYLTINLALRAVRRLEIHDSLLAQVKLLLLITPIIAVEVMSYRAYGLVGFAIAFVPVMLLAYSLRSVADAGRQNSDLVRRNRRRRATSSSAARTPGATTCGKRCARSRCRRRRSSRYFQEAIVKEIHRHERTGHEFALAMLDIDNFKRVNDTFGHPVGDEMLKGIVEELMGNARDSDIVSRYGGEEFAIIFPDTPLASARDAATRMLELVGRREFPMPQTGRTLRIKVSVGVAVYPHDGTTATDLVARADNALYFAKKNGKNQVAMAGEIDAEDVVRSS